MSLRRKGKKEGKAEGRAQEGFFLEAWRALAAQDSKAEKPCLLAPAMGSGDRGMVGACDVKGNAQQRWVPQDPRSRAGTRPKGAALSRQGSSWEPGTISHKAGVWVQPVTTDAHGELHPPPRPFWTPGTAGSGLCSKQGEAGTNSALASASPSESRQPQDTRNSQRRLPRARPPGCVH